MIAVDCRVLADLGVSKVPGLLLGCKDRDILVQRALVALQRQDVVSLLVDDLFHDLALAAHCLDRHDRPVDRQHVEKPGDRDDLIGFFRHLDLARHKTLACGESLETRRERYNEIVREVAMVTHVTLCEIDKAFPSSSDAELRGLLLPEPDVLHLSPVGHRVYAQAIQEYLEAAIEDVTWRAEQAG